MIYRNVSLEIKQLKRSLELWRELRAENHKKRDATEKARHALAVQSIDELAEKLKEVEFVRERM